MWSGPPDPNRDPDEPAFRRYSDPLADPGEMEPPGAVKAVSVLLYISCAFQLLLAVLLVAAASAASSGVLVLFAGVYAVGACVAGVGGYKIRQGSRGWRNLVVVLCALSVVLSVIDAFSTPISLAGVVINGLCIYLLVGARESQDFFEGG